MFTADLRCASVTLRIDSGPARNGRSGAYPLGRCALVANSSDTPLHLQKRTFSHGVNRVNGFDLYP